MTDVRVVELGALDTSKGSEAIGVLREEVGRHEHPSTPVWRHGAGGVIEAQLRSLCPAARRLETVIRQQARHGADSWSPPARVYDREEGFGMRLRGRGFEDQGFGFRVQWGEARAGPVSEVLAGRKGLAPRVRLALPPADTVGFLSVKKNRWLMLAGAGRGSGPEPVSFAAMHTLSHPPKPLSVAIHQSIVEVPRPQAGAAPP